MAKCQACKLVFRVFFCDFCLVLSMSSTSSRNCLSYSNSICTMAFLVGKAAPMACSKLTRDYGDCRLELCRLNCFVWLIIDWRGGNNLRYKRPMIKTGQMVSRIFGRQNILKWKQQRQAQLRGHAGTQSNVTICYLCVGRPFFNHLCDRIGELPFWVSAAARLLQWNAVLGRNRLSTQSHWEQKEVLELLRLKTLDISRKHY
jgi:hypothetical protein